MRAALVCALALIAATAAWAAAPHGLTVDGVNGNVASVRFSSDSLDAFTLHFACDNGATGSDDLPLGAHMALAVLPESTTCSLHVSPTGDDSVSSNSVSVTTQSASMVPASTPSSAASVVASRRVVEKPAPSRVARNADSLSLVNAPANVGDVCTLDAGVLGSPSVVTTGACSATDSDIVVNDVEERTLTVTVYYLATCNNYFDFYWNGVLVSHNTMSYDCTCYTPVRSFQVTLTFADVNTVRFMGNNYMAWARMEFEYRGEHIRQVLFDYGGGNADVTDLCQANYFSMSSFDASTYPTSNAATYIKCFDVTRTWTVTDASCGLTASASQRIARRFVGSSGLQGLFDFTSIPYNQVDLSTSNLGEPTGMCSASHVDATTSAALTELRVYALHTACGYDTLKIYVNEVLVVSSVDSYTCSCYPGLKSYTVTDPAVLGQVSAAVTAAGNVVTVRGSLSQYLAYFRVDFVRPGYANEIVYFDAVGSSTRPLSLSGDLCNPSYSYMGIETSLTSPMHPSLITSAAFTRTWSLTWGCSTSTFIQTVLMPETPAGPTEPPVISAPADVTVECTASTEPSSTGVASATDAFDGADLAAPTYSDATSGDSCHGTIARTWSVTNSGDYSASATQTINVVDTTAPSVSVPADATVEAGADADTTPSATGSATADDDCNAVNTEFADATTGDSCSATISRTWTATDACGNSASGVQTISVVDTTAPALSAPADVSVECTASVDPAQTGAATASDFNAVEVDYSDDVAYGANGAIAVTTRTWWAADACGNEAEATQTITVVDTTAPVAAVRSLCMWPPNSKYVCFSAVSVSSSVFAVSDNCGSSVSRTFVGCSSDEAQSAIGQNCFYEAAADRLCIKSERLGSGDGRVYMTQWTVKDSFGNSASVSQAISVPHDDTELPGCDSVFTPTVTFRSKKN